MSRQAWLGLLAVIITSALLIFYSRPAAEFTVNLFFESSNDQPPSTLQVATLETMTGKVNVRHEGSPTESLPILPAPLYHLDQLRIERDSSAQIKFPSGWIITVYENSLGTLELYRTGQSDSPALLSLIRGDYQVLTAGRTGMLFIMKDKKVFSPNSRPEENVRHAVLAPVKDDTHMQTAESDITHQADPLPSEAPFPQLPSAMKPGKLPDKIAHGEDETLSSRYIEERLSTQASDLRRCQLNSVRDDRPSEGRMLASITILPNGRVEKVKMLQDQVRNEQLANCVTSVLERARFESFKGLPITLTYPIEFR